MSDEPCVFRVLIYSGKTLHSHMQIMLLPERGDGLHHRCCMMRVDGRLICPAVDQKNRLRIIQGNIVFIPEIARFRTDGGNCPDGVYFYQLTFGRNQIEETLQGSVTIIRK